MQCTIRHSIPGRLRLKLAPGAVREAETRLAALDGVIGIRVNPACGAVIIRYDSKKTGPQELIRSLGSSTSPRQTPFGTLKRSLATAGIRKKKARKIPFPKSSEAETAVQPIRSACLLPPAAKALDPQQAVFRQECRRFAGLTAVMGGLLVSRLVFRTVLAQTLLSPLGVLSLAAAWPLLRQSGRHLRERRFTLEGFLAAGCVTATVAGQAVTALEILWVHSGAECLNAWAADRSRKSIAGILELTEKNTYVLEGDVEVELPVASVTPGQTVIVHTGEKISVDGEVLSGEALIDTASITGRAELQLAQTGTRVFAGTFVHKGIIQVRADCVGDQTYLSRIMRKVQDALENRAPIESTADRLARTMVRLGLAATLGALFLTGNVTRAFTVMLVMACPCATSLSARTAVGSAMTAAARRGILIKGGRYLEEVGKADAACFDKTGTLTSSEPRIETILNLSDNTEEELLLWAYSAEVHNQHPLAAALKKAAQKRGLEPLSHLECDFTLGKGVRAVIGKDVIRLGSRRYLTEEGIDVAESAERARYLQEKGMTVVFLSLNETVKAAFGFANEPRPDAASTLLALRETGIRTISVITGDSEQTALAFCQSMQVDDCVHSVLPEQKGAVVASLRGANRQVIMVGDGINDAPALAEADIGIAMGAAGSDVAIETADIVLVKNDLAELLYLRDLSRRTIRTAEQNFRLALATNLAGAVAGMLGYLTPVSAGLLHIAHTVGVMANSSRLLLAAPSNSLAGARRKQRNRAAARPLRGVGAKTLTGTDDYS